jgi:hypothetical protein
MPSSARSKRRSSPRRQRDLALPSGSSVPRLNLKSMARLTNDEVKKRGSEVSVRPFSMDIDINDVGAYKILYCNTLHNTVVHTTAAMVYHHTGEIPDDTKKLRSLMKIPFGSSLWSMPAWVTCDCEYFMYHCEVALHRFNSSDVLHSNGAFPGMTNPRMAPKLCKHLYAVAPVLVQVRRKPTGREIPHSRRPQHPPHRGRLPKHLTEHLDRHTFVPAPDEIDQSMDFVTDFI